MKKLLNRIFWHWYFIPTSCNSCGPVIGTNEHGFQLQNIESTTYYFLWMRLTVKRDRLRFFSDMEHGTKCFGSKKVFSVNTSVPNYLAFSKHFADGAGQY